MPRSDVRVILLSGLVGGAVDTLLRVRFPRYGRWQAERTRKRRARPVWLQLLLGAIGPVLAGLTAEWVRRNQEWGIEHPEEARRLLSEKADEIRTCPYAALAENLPPPRPLVQALLPREREETTDVVGPSGTPYELHTRIAYRGRAGGPIGVRLMLGTEDYAGVLHDEFEIAPS
jgi:hypothetical protein